MTRKKDVSKAAFRRSKNSESSDHGSAMAHSSFGFGICLSSLFPCTCVVRWFLMEPPLKPLSSRTWYWKSPMFNRKYIDSFMVDFPACHLSFCWGKKYWNIMMDFESWTQHFRLNLEKNQGVSPILNQPKTVGGIFVGGRSRCKKELPNFGSWKCSGNPWICRTTPCVSHVRDFFPFFFFTIFFFGILPDIFWHLVWHFVWHQYFDLSSCSHLNPSTVWHFIWHFGRHKLWHLI